jgi:hypothetical protein
MRCIILAVGITLCAASGDLQAQQRDAWQDFWQNVQKQRDSRDQGLRDWWPNVSRGYDRWRDDATPKDDEIVLELDDLDVPAGRYSVQLPTGGTLRVHVRPGAGERPGQGVWPPRVYDEVERLAARMSADLRWLHYGAQQLNFPNLAARSQELPAFIDGVRQAAARRAPVGELRKAFAQFDEEWHRLAHEIHRADMPDWMKRRAETITDHDERLHRLLRVGQAPVYDRLKVAALTQYLNRQTRSLVNLNYDLNSAHEAELRRLAERVHRHAEDLAGAVRRNAPLAEIADDYERFDQTWHHMRERAWTPSGVREQFRQLLQVMGPIDIALHRELKVQPPVVLERERLQALVEQIKEGADHVARDLDYDLKRDPRDLSEAARRVAYAADRVQQRLAAVSVHDEARREVDYLLQAWSEFQRRIPRNIDAQRFAHTLRVYEQLKEDVRQLQTLTS